MITLFYVKVLEFSAISTTDLNKHLVENMKNSFTVITSNLSIKFSNFFFLSDSNFQSKWGITFSTLSYAATRWNRKTIRKEHLVLPKEYLYRIELYLQLNHRKKCRIVFKTSLMKSSSCYQN